MKKTKFFLELILLAVFGSSNIFAQMVTQMNTFRTERTIPNTEEYNPIKSIAINSGTIISLINESNQQQQYLHNHYVIQSEEPFYPPFVPAASSSFIKTVEGSSIVAITTISNITITDFEYDEANKTILFCGVLNNGTYSNVVCEVNVDYLFNTAANTIPLIPINNLNPSSYLKKIDFFKKNYNETHLLLIANNNDSTTIFNNNSSNQYFPCSQFIDYNLSANIYDVYEVNSIRLTDVIHTNNRICVVGIKDRAHLVLFSHDKNNINNYKGFVFNTYPLYDVSTDIKYNISPIPTNNNSDLIVIGASLIANSDGRMEFSIFDLTSQDI